MSQSERLTTIAFTGKDAADFLHNQLTVDVRALRPGAAGFAALCQPKGRVLALLLLLAEDDRLRAVCASALATKVIDYLTKFIFRDKVTLEREEGVQVVSNPDPGLSGVLSAAAPLPGLVYGLRQRDDSSPEAETAAGAHARELAEGVAWLDGATSEQFLPQMLGHGAIGALDFHKGCFPGQEVIARTQYLGKLKRHPWSGRIQERLPLEAMGELSLEGAGGAASAVLVDQAEHVDGGWQVLAVARRPESLEVDRLVIGDDGCEADGRWLNDGLPRSASEPPA